MQIFEDRIVYDWRDFITGFAPQQQLNGVNLVGQGGQPYGASYMLNFDPYNGVPGGAQPGFTPTSFTNVSSEPTSILVATASDWTADQAFAIGGAKIQKITPSSDTLVVSSWPHTIVAEGSHSSGSHTDLDMSLGDCVMYHVAGTKRFFFSYNDSVDWDVGTHLVSSSTPSVDEDFMSTVPATPLGTTAADLTDGKGLPHPMIVSAIDGKLHIGSGRYVHTYDGDTGANGTFSARALDIYRQYVITTFAENQYDLVIFGSSSVDPTTGRFSGRKGQAAAFFWSANRPSAPYRISLIDDDYVSGGFAWQGTVGCFTTGRNGTRSCLRILENGSFVSKFFWVGTPPGNRGVYVNNDLIMWVADGLVYSWGTKDASFPRGVYQLCSGSGTTDYGFLTTLRDNTLSASTGTGTSGGLEKFGNYSANAFWQGLTAAPNFPQGKRGRLKEVKITFGSSAASGRTLDLTFFINSSQTLGTVINNLATVTASNMVIRYEIDTSGKPLESYEFENIKPALTWETGSGSAQAPIIEKIEFFYDTVNIIST